MDTFIKNGLTVGSQQTIRNLWANRNHPEYGSYYREVIRDNVRIVKGLRSEQMTGVRLVKEKSKGLDSIRIKMNLNI
jgi:hypothetical protein